jgi:hypothetical protein
MVLYHTVLTGTGFLGKCLSKIQRKILFCSHGWCRMAQRWKGHLQYSEKRKTNLALIKTVDILEDGPYRPYEAVHNAPRETHPYLRNNMLGLSTA